MPYDMILVPTIIFFSFLLHLERRSCPMSQRSVDSLLNSDAWQTGHLTWHFVRATTDNRFSLTAVFVWRAKQVVISHNTRFYGKFDNDRSPSLEVLRCF